MVTFSEAKREQFWWANERLKKGRLALPMEPRRETSRLKPEMRVRVRRLTAAEPMRQATVRASCSSRQCQSRRGTTGKRFPGRPARSRGCWSARVPCRTSRRGWLNIGNVAPPGYSRLSSQPAHSDGDHVLLKGARPHSPVAVPVSWDELGGIDNPALHHQ